MLYMAMSSTFGQENVPFGSVFAAVFRPCIGSCLACLYPEYLGDSLSDSTAFSGRIVDFIRCLSYALHGYA